MVKPPQPPNEEQGLVARQARVFENIYDSVILTDLTGRIIDCNPATEKMFGYTRAELLGQPPRIWHRPEEAAKLTAKILDGVRQNQRWSSEITFIRKDGLAGVCEVVVVPVYDEHDRHVVTIGVSHDITRQKREEQELKQCAAALQAIFQALPDLFLRLDDQGMILDCQAGPAFDLHLSDAALVNHHLHEIFPLDIAQQIKRAVTHALDTISLVTTEYSLPLPRGEQNFEARLLPIFNRQVIAIVRDITERKQAEQALRTSETRFRTLTTHAPVGIFQTNVQGDCIFVNKRWCEITGVPAAEAMGNGWTRSLHPDDREQVIRTFG